MLLFVLLLLTPAAWAGVILKRSLGEGLQVVFEDGDDSAPLRDEDFYQAYTEKFGEIPPGADVPEDMLGSANVLGARRSGTATKTHSCSHIRSVPTELRSSRTMYPYGLTNWYQKYTEAYGIPVVSSASVSNDALKRACYTLRFLMADHSGVRQQYFARSGRVGLMGIHEYTTQIPEHSWLDPTFWNARARGLGATEEWPISTGAEENVLCHTNDKWGNEDIFLHEFAHGVHLLGAKYAIRGFDANLQYWYNQRRAQGLWARTYAIDTYKEYFAEGVQSYFHCNAEAIPTNGIHNHVNTRAELRSYDYELFKLVEQVFPCRNTYINRCRKSRAEEARQRLKMNCNEGDGEEEEGEDGDDNDDGEDNNPRPKPPPINCEDKETSCNYWQQQGYCSSYEEYMTKNCKKACGLCGDPACTDDNQHCQSWASSGYCSSYRDYMNKNCKKSCNKC